MEPQHINDWDEKYQSSLSQQESDIALLKEIIPDCVNVEKTSVAVDRLGVDYIATLSGGATINVDVKYRLPGCSYWWTRGEPELALEISSVQENDKIGWTLNTSTQVDYILFTFDESDCDKSYLIPFQLLRAAFLANKESWIDEYGIKTQKSNTWTSTAVFVPASIVLAAIDKEMIIAN